MKSHIPLAAMAGSLALLVTFGTPLAAQTLPAAAEAPTVLAMAEAGGTLRLTVGHFKLLQADEPFGTIIVGDDTIANATVGTGNTIVLTGLAAGSTNLIVLNEAQQPLVSATVDVVPVAGPLRSMVTVLRGAEAPETYECRGTACQRMAADDEQRERPYLLLAAPDAAPAQAAPAAGSAAE